MDRGGLTGGLARSIFSPYETKERAPSGGVSVILKTGLPYGTRPVGVCFCSTGREGKGFRTHSRAASVPPAG